MPSTLVDGVSLIASSSGTGDFVSGATRSSFISLADAVTNGVLTDGDQVSYVAVDNVVTPSQREWGHGTFSAGSSSIARTTVLGGSAGPGTAVDFSVVPTVSLTALAEDFPAPSVTPGSIYGLTMAPNGNNDTRGQLLNIAAGSCSDSSGAVIIALGSFQKSLAGSFVEGSSNNGMGNGLTVANNTWYHVFAIINSDLTSDIYFDTDPGAANAPSGTLYFRRIGSIKTDGAANLYGFLQIGNEFVWEGTGSTTLGNWGFLEISAATISPGGQQNTLAGVPPAVRVLAHLMLQVTYVSSGDWIIVSPYPEVANYANMIASNGLSVSVTAQIASSPFDVLTSTAQKVNLQSQSGNATANLLTIGYTDFRGQFGNP
jgi:hypothetical protein